MDPDSPWTVKVLTLFTEMFPGPLGLSLAGRGLADGAWELEKVDIRTFAGDKHRAVDDAPFGGGPGMVMRAEVIARAIDAAGENGGTLPLIYLTPRGRPLTQSRVRALAEGPGVILLCGRFEGVDQRVLDEYRAEEISIGDFVLSGGEPAAIALIDACLRLLPGIVGRPGSLAEESFENGLLEYPHYTRPQIWRGRTVPEVLASGHHEKVRAWRLAEAEAVTRAKRPDLWARYKELENGSRPRTIPAGPAKDEGIRS
ncbi:MAG TPA: tRNA (guanosine(37)-N1)-methyltransferase TrmD [Rhodospirillales bacterium]|jgi:tRNA (guanine37-N1)-methyltransferase|nr:tRNA (guanosine(37)-N1)-methyltransferase TrmD [Rhodospirillales bacterium]